MRILMDHEGSETAPPRTSDLAAQFGTLRQTDPARTVEFVMCHLVLVTACTILSYAHDYMWFLAWCVLYICLNSLWIARLRSSRTSVPTIGQYRSFVLLNLARSWVYAGGLLFLWMYMDTPDLKAVACCGLTGQILRNLARTESWTAVSVTDVGTVLGTVLIGGGFQILQAETLAGQGMIGLLTVVVAGYYWFAQTMAVRVQRSLNQSREATRRAGKMSTMGQLTAGISHDFKNMLAVIQGHIDMADHASTPEQRAASLAEARMTANEASTTINRLLSTTRPDTLPARTVDLRDRLQVFARSMARVLPSHIELTVSTGDEELPISVDVHNLEMALLNLVINARDAMDETGGKVEISLSCTHSENWPDGVQPAGPGFVRIDISDEGTGIPQHMMSSVTEPLVSTKPPDSGSGLGLAMVQDFLNDNGGEMYLQNRERGGLLVSLLLPCERAGDLAA